jgi:hypothetical protein
MVSAMHVMRAGVQTPIEPNYFDMAQIVAAALSQKGPEGFHAFMRISVEQPGQTR